MCARVCLSYSDGCLEHRIQQLLVLANTISACYELSMVAEVITTSTLQHFLLRPRLSLLSEAASRGLNRPLGCPRAERPQPAPGLPITAPTGRWPAVQVHPARASYRQSGLRSGELETPPEGQPRLAEASTCIRHMNKGKFTLQGPQGPAFCRREKGDGQLLKAYQPLGFKSR